MARQIGEIILVGTIGGLTFYQMEGKGYARLKSSLTGKRVKKDPRFKRTMESAWRLGRASQLASKVYRSLARKEQVYALFTELKRIGIKELKEGRTEAEVLELLSLHLGKEIAVVPVSLGAAVVAKAKTTVGERKQQLNERWKRSAVAIRRNGKALFCIPFKDTVQSLPRLYKQSNCFTENKNAGQVESPASKECVVKLFSG
jgi:hypothetical protein